MTMAAQRYSRGLARERMSRGRCPECDSPPEEHGNDNRFWTVPPGACSLLERGVVDRIAQYESELSELEETPS